MVINYTIIFKNCSSDVDLMYGTRRPDRYFQEVEIYRTAMEKSRRPLQRYDFTISTLQSNFGTGSTTYSFVSIISGTPVSKLS